MAEIKPFSATRFSEKKFPTPPVAPPYDVISEKQRQEIAADHFNIIHLDKPGSENDAEKYTRAAKLLKDWQEQGVLIRENQDSFYFYEQEYSVPELDDQTVLRRRGFFTCMKLEDYDKKVVLPHEKTLSGPKIDRFELLKQTKANLSPIFGLYHDDSSLINNCFEKVVATSPIYETYVDKDGTKHRLWQVADKDMIQKVQLALSDKKVIIADGHHRYETSLQYSKYSREELKAQNPKADYIMICLTDFSDDGLVVLPTHRLVQSQLSVEEVIAGLEKYFVVKESSLEELKPYIQDLDPKETVLGFYAGKNKPYYKITLKEGIDYASFMPEKHTGEWKALNVNLLSFVVFKKIFSFDDATFQKNVSYSHSLFETIETVDQNEVPYAFFLQSIDKFKVKEISENAELMPQKSTYFYPKLYTGFVMYEH